MGILPIRYQVFTALDRPPRHGSFSRLGGVSTGRLAELNVGLAVGDEPARVAENRRRIKEVLGFSQLVSCRQVHGDRVAVVRRPPPEDLELDGFDALVSDCPGVGLMICQADCQAVLLYDPRRRVAANIHAGWRGSVANIIAATVATMAAEYDCRPVDLRAAISPSLGPCCAEMVNHQRELPATFASYQVQENFFDFPAISRYQLLAAGLCSEYIEWAGLCTRCRPDFFSYRREPAGGRNASVIGVP